MSCPYRAQVQAVLPTGQVAACIGGSTASQGHKAEIMPLHRRDAIKWLKHFAGIPLDVLLSHPFHSCSALAASGTPFTSQHCCVKLPAVSVLATVSHAQDAGAVMLQLQSALFVVERPPMDAVATRAIPPHDVASLADKALHNAVELVALQKHTAQSGEACMVPERGRDVVACFIARSLRLLVCLKWEYDVHLRLDGMPCSAELSCWPCLLPSRQCTSSGSSRMPLGPAQPSHSLRSAFSTSSPYPRPGIERGIALTSSGNRSTTSLPALMFLGASGVNAACMRH